MDNYSVEALSDMPDETLVLLCKEQPQAFDVLLERYRKKVADMARVFAASPADRDDYVQEGMLGLLAAVSAFQQGRGTSFHTYAVICIRNRMRNIFEKEHSASSMGSAQSTLSLDDPESDADELLADVTESPDEVFLEKEHISELYAKLAAVLSKQERQIFLYAVSGLSYEQIAAKMQITVKSVDNAIQRARRKLRAVWSQNTAADPCAEPQDRPQQSG